MHLNGAVVFVTGGNRGLGLAFAKEALKRGASKVYVGVRQPKNFNVENIQAVELDVTDPESVQRAAAACGDLNLLVNNAGIALLSDGALDPGLIDQSERIFATNYYGVVRTTQAFADTLGKNAPSAIVNVLSDATWVSAPMLAAYAASKHAAWSFTNSLRLQTKPRGIEVLGLHVGFLDTDMTAGVDVPKSDPNDVAAAALSALEQGSYEVLADAGTEKIKASLSSDSPAYIHPDLPF
ncbi:SDR family oxidoreductase [Paraburkholderia strydomiana]